MMDKKEKEKKEAVLRLIEYLKDEYHYAPVPLTLELGDVRQTYRRMLPEWCRLEGDNCALVTQAGTILSHGYKRIVIGDYGAFVEFAPEQAIRSHIRVKAGQEFRMNDPAYANCKYLWLTAKDSSDVKIYFQKHTVDYADYVPGMMYVSPYDVYPTHSDESK